MTNQPGFINLLRNHFDYELNAMPLIHAMAIMNLYKQDIAEGVKLDKDDRQTVMDAFELVRANDAQN